jgi:hypothetical protein
VPEFVEGQRRVDRGDAQDCGDDKDDDQQRDIDPPPCVLSLRPVFREKVRVRVRRDFRFKI